MCAAFIVYAHVCLFTHPALSLKPLMLRRRSGPAGSWFVLVCRQCKTMRLEFLYSIFLYHYFSDYYLFIQLGRHQAATPGPSGFNQLKDVLSDKAAN